MTFGRTAAAAYFNWNHECPNLQHQLFVKILQNKVGIVGIIRIFWQKGWETPPVPIPQTKKIQQKQQQTTISYKWVNSVEGNSNFSRRTRFRTHRNLIANLYYQPTRMIWLWQISVHLINTIWTKKVSPDGQIWNFCRRFQVMTKFKHRQFKHHL